MSRPHCSIAQVIMMGTLLFEPLLNSHMTAYFDNCYDAVFGALNRPDFEGLLRSHFQRGHCSPEDDDPSFLALRNVVYAAGFRSILAKDPSVSFADAQIQAWRYFENALSVLGDVLFNPTDLTAVRALVLMVRLSTLLTYLEPNTDLMPPRLST